MNIERLVVISKFNSGNHLKSVKQFFTKADLKGIIEAVLECSMDKVDSIDISSKRVEIMKGNTVLGIESWDLEKIDYRDWETLFK